jgi:phage-related protein
VITVLVGVFKIVQMAFSTMTAILAANPFILIAIAVAAIAILIITHWTQIKAFLGAVWDGIKKVAGVVWNSITGFFGDVVRDIEGVLGGMGRLGAHLWDWLGSGLKFVVDGVLKGINWMIDRVNGLIHGINDVTGVVGIGHIPDIPHVPYLAAGGLITAGGLARVGERGAETVALPKGAAVFPRDSEPAGSGNGSGTVFQVMPGGSGLDALFVTWLKKAVRVRGGNPVVFGP